MKKPKYITAQLKTALALLDSVPVLLKDRMILDHKTGKVYTNKSGKWKEVKK